LRLKIRRRGFGPAVFFGEIEARVRSRPLRSDRGRTFPAAGIPPIANPLAADLY